MLEIVVQHTENIKTFYFVHYRHVGDCCPAHWKHQNILFCTLQTCWRLLSSTLKTSKHFIMYITDMLEIVVQHTENIKTFYFVHYRHVGDCCPAHWKHQNILLCTLQTCWRLLSSTLKTSKHFILYITDMLEIVVQHTENIKTFYFVHYRHVGDCCPAHWKHQNILLCTLQTCWRLLSSTLKTSKHFIMYITDMLEIVVQHTENIKTFYFVHCRRVGDISTSSWTFLFYALHRSWTFVIQHIVTCKRFHSVCCRGTRDSRHVVEWDTNRDPLSRSLHELSCCSGLHWADHHMVRGIDESVWCRPPYDEVWCRSPYGQGHRVFGADHHTVRGVECLVQTTIWWGA